MKFHPQAHDILLHKHSGNVCDNHDNQPITWQGHLCEGADLTAPIGHNFCLWTKCGKHDVPANSAEVGYVGLVTCPDCIALNEPSEADQGLIPIPDGYAEQ